MYIKKTPKWSLKESEVTPEPVYRQRRDILKKLGITLVGMPLATHADAGLFDRLLGTEPEPTPDKRRALAPKAQPIPTVRSR